MTIHQLYTIIFALLLTAALGPISTQADTVHPLGSSVTVTHTLNATSLPGGDTLIITRSVANHSPYPLAGLYLSQTLPPDFYVAGSQAKVNGTVIAVSFSGKPVDPVISGYNTYHWIVDDPGGSLGVHRTLQPGDSLELTIRAVCGRTGQYTLPDRAAIFLANGNGYFSTMGSTPPVVTIQPCCEVRGNVDGDYGMGGAVDVADISYLVNYLFRQGPPPPCLDEANADASTGTGVIVNVADLAFLVEYLFRSGPGPISCGN